MSAILADTGAILAKVRLLILILAVSNLACGGTFLATPTAALDLYPSPSSEAAPVVRVTTTPLPTYTPVYTFTPVSPSATPSMINWLCVTAEEAVYLRPSPSTENYPIIQLENGQKVFPEGGETEGWVFVSLGDKRGWINGKYVQPCGE